MIIKDKAESSDSLTQLKELKKLQLTAQQRFLIDREIKMVSSGIRGEENSAYFLDFEWGTSENWGIIHDLRVEHKGRVAQIDHLLINRYLELYVLETKNFSYGVKINDLGEFNVWNGKSYSGIESPIEQNHRHIRVLETIVKDKGFTPKRLGLAIPATFHSFILMSSKSRIDRTSVKKFDTKNVIKADQFKALIDKSFDQASVGTTFGRVAKIIGKDTLKDFVQSIADLHCPITIDYRAKFGITKKPVSRPMANETTDPDQKYKRPTKPEVNRAENANDTDSACDKCGVHVESKVVNYCRFNRVKLGGHKILCQSCQKQVVKTQAVKSEKSDVKLEITGVCEKCGADVNSKVVYYCRFNRKKLGGFKVLCPTCQKSV